MSDSPYHLDDNSGPDPERCECCGQDVGGPYRLCDDCYSWQQHRCQHAHGSTEAWWLVLRLMDLPEEVDPVRVERLINRAVKRFDRRQQQEFAAIPTA